MQADRVLSPISPHCRVHDSRSPAARNRDESHDAKSWVWRAHAEPRAGAGLRTRIRRTQGCRRNFLPGSPGEYYWVGAAGTAFWVDPSEKLVTVMMVQIPLAQGRHYRSVLRNLVYQAVSR